MKSCKCGRDKLRIIVLITAACLAQAGAIINGQIANASPRATETIGASGSPSQSLTSYLSPEAQMQLAYPRQWHIQLHPDKDNVFKITNSTGIGEVTLSVNPDPNANPDKLAQMLPIELSSHLQAFHQIAEKKVYFGISRRIEGVMLDVSFEMNGAPIRQRYVLFSHAGKTNILVFTAVASQFDTVLPAFHDILLSIQPSAAGSHSVAIAPAAHASFEQFEASNVPLRFAYPSGWQVSETNDPDHPVQIVGHEADRRHGVIAVYSGGIHPNMSLDETFAQIEDRYLKSHSRYKAVHQETCSFGSGANLEGVLHEASYEENGIPAQMRSMFFRDKQNRSYLMAFHTIGWKDSDANAMFRKILATVQLQQ